MRGDMAANLATGGWLRTCKNAGVTCSFAIMVLGCGRVRFDDVTLVSSDCGVDSGLVAWWPFDELAGDVTADRAAGNDATLLGGAALVAGHLGRAVELDGLDGRLDVAGEVAYATQAAPFSFAAWFLLADYVVSPVPDIMQIKSDTASPFHVLLSIDPSWAGISFGSGDGSWARAKTMVQPTLGAWHHIVVTYSGAGAADLGSFAIFLDGALQPLAVASPYATQPQQSRIGAAIDPRNQWHGLIDDVRIYDRVLATDEVPLVACN